jgi:hypothetical protein
MILFPLITTLIWFKTLSSLPFSADLLEDSRDAVSLQPVSVEGNQI